MPYVTYKNKKYLARWPESWNDAIIKVAQESFNEAASDTYCDVPYKCRELKFSMYFYCHIGQLKRKGKNTIRHEFCELKRAKISWAAARRDGKLSIIPLEYTGKDLSTHYKKIRLSLLPESQEKENKYRVKYFHENYKKCKTIAKATRKRRDQLFNALPKKIIKSNKYPKEVTKKNPLPDTPTNIKRRKYALKYKEQNYKKFTTMQYERNKLKTAMNRQFLENLLLSKGVRSD